MRWRAGGIQGCVPGLAGATKPWGQCGGPGNPVTPSVCHPPTPGRVVFRFQVTNHPGTFLPFFFLSFFPPLSYSPADQLFNTFHPSAELPEVSCFKLNTFLFESTGVPEKFLALQMSSLEFWNCTWISLLCFFFIFIISNLVLLCSRFSLFPTAVLYALTDQNNFKRSELKGLTWNFLRELMWVNCLYLIVPPCLESF